MLSIWEKTHFIRYDIIIVGSGIVGLSTALYLQQKYPQQSILILERGILPSGASTKNAGFACMGSLSELIDDASQNGVDDMLSVFTLRRKGLFNLRSILNDEELGYEQSGSYELLMDGDEDTLSQLEEFNKYLYDETGCDTFRIRPELAGAFGFGGVKGVVENTCEGSIDTGLMMKNLIRKVKALGVDIITGADVLSYEESKGEVSVVCQNPLMNNTIAFRSSRLVICNNAFARTLIPDLDVNPGRGQVLITKPVANLPFKGIFHFDKGYYYFRELNGCVLFGGGRNQDFAQESTTSFSINEKIQYDLVEKLHQIILPGRSVSIDMRWTGIMAFGKHKRPLVLRHSEHVYVGVRMGGMGVAIGSEVGRMLAEMI